MILKNYNEKNIDLLIICRQAKIACIFLSTFNIYRNKKSNDMITKS